MPRRRSGFTGFTLIEIMVGLVITSLVALLAYGVAQVGYDARARVVGHLRDVQSARAFQTLLGDALRNVRTPDRTDEPGFGLHNGTLSFVAAGGAPPLDPDYNWLIHIAPGPQGLELAATPLGRADAVRVTFRSPDITSWNVRVLDPNNAQWIQDWSTPRITPRAIAISFWHNSVTTGLPLEVVLWPGTPK
ncbi:MAG TPA: prepilin-type N-terminal cleavage/methylation domain-containing protein [Gemmatimonadaceae bacterium]|nr:prepilin-type N-terminal cleavage/methylation domain-containing protein [Gemmatimonadaceae bacterium]